MLDLRTKTEDKRKDKNTRELINLFAGMPDYTKMYWINALYTQGKIEASTAGRLLIKEGLI